jgi:hypothetical protein
MLDLDALEREGTPGPFTVKLAGRPWKLADPQELDWKQLDQLGTVSAEMDLRMLLGEQFAEFRKLSLPGWKFEKLMEAWRTHYGLGSQGEADASST